MAKRYYISRIVGNGTHETPYTSELRDYIYANWPNEPHFIKQVMPSGNIIMWCFHKYDLSQACHDDVMANVPQAFAFPEGALDRQLSSIAPNLRNAMRNKLEGIGFDFGWATLTNTVRDVLEYIAHSIQLAEWAKVTISNKNFDLNKTAADIPIEKRQIVNQHLQDLGVDTSWITSTTTIKEIVARVQLNRYGSNFKRWFFHDEDTE